MILQNLFENDVLRNINPAVVVADATQETVDQEITEYVFTAELIGHIHTLLDVLLHKKKGKTAVWVNGYYGSGKSHYIKYVSYCLSPTTKQKALDNFVSAVRNQSDTMPEVTLSAAEAIKRSINTFDVEQVIFNIDEVSGDKNHKNVLVKIFFNQFHRFRGFNSSNITLALLLEKPLAEQNLFQAFQDKIQANFNTPWQGNQTNFADRQLESILQIAKSLDGSLDIIALHAAISNPKDYTLQDLVAELRTYANAKSEQFRLVFLVDEVSQYIGNNTSLLLNLQTLVESIATECNNKVWMICTAQQELHNIVSNTDNKTEDFGKILGRFETRISLQTTDAAYITKKRLLEKNSNAIALLQDYYAKQKGSIENQYALIHDLYPSYTNREDFILTYPYIPYQFQLISDVFASFSALKYVGEGVKNTERSILGITHYTNKDIKEKELGFFVPFDAFFNNQLESNLTHLANNILQRAYNIEAVKKDIFAKRVVKTLFMISNLTDTLRINFPATIDNITLLMYESINQSKQEQREKIANVLNQLVQTNIVQEVENTYSFLKEDEIEVANLIENTQINANQRIELFYEEIINKVQLGRSDQKYSLGNNSFKAVLKIDDKQYGNPQNADFIIQYLIYENQPVANIALNTNKNELKIALHEWFANDTIFKTDFMRYARTAACITQYRATASGLRSETYERFGRNNQTLLQSLQKRYREKLKETNFIIGQHVIYANELQGEPTNRFNTVVERHLTELYSKHNLSNNYATRNEELVVQLNNKQTAAIKDLTATEQEMDSKIQLNGEGFNVDDLVKLFEKSPYGWKDISTIDVLLRLVQKEKRRIEFKNEAISNESMIGKATNSRERAMLQIFPEQGIPIHELQQFIKVVNFDIILCTLSQNSSDAKQTILDFKNNLKPILAAANKIKEEQQRKAFVTHFNQYHKLLAAIYEMRNDHDVLKNVIAQSEILKEARDNYTNATEFVATHNSTFDEIGKFINSYGSNFNALDDTTKIKGERLQEWHRNDTTPWERFPEMKKIHKELETAIKEHIKQYRAEVLTKYTQAFEDLEAKRENLSIKDANVLPSSSHFLEKIEKEKDIRELQLTDNRFAKFQADYQKVLIDEKARLEAEAGRKTKTAEIYTVNEDPDFNSTQIENEAQLDDYLQKLRRKLITKLQNDKIIIIS